MICFVFLSLVVAWVSSESDENIFNGYPANEGDFPYQVGLYLYINDTSWAMCSGSLISNTFIITAAHCVDFISVENIAAWMGDLDYQSGTKRVPNYKIVHPDWDPILLHNDIALLQIDYITYTDYILNVDLPVISDYYSSYEANVVIASGWGMTENDFGSELIPTENNICTAAPNLSGPCGGDSGGPLVDKVSTVLIGIASFANTGCFYQNGSGYTRVTSYRQWIYDNTGV